MKKYTLLLALFFAFGTSVVIAEGQQNIEFASNSNFDADELDVDFIRGSDYITASDFIDDELDMDFISGSESIAMYAEEEK